MTDAERLLRIGDVLSKYKHVCAVCGCTFEGRQGAKYCSSACRQKAYRERQKRNGRPGKARDDVVRRIGGMSSVTRDWLRSHEGPLVSVTVGFIKGEGMRMME